MKIIKNKGVVADTINNKKYEIELELEFNLAFVDGNYERIEQTINDIITDKYNYKIHKKFIKDFIYNGYSRFCKMYWNYCKGLCEKQLKGKDILTIQIAKMQKYHSVKMKFKKYLINQNRKKLRELEKCFDCFFEDDKYYAKINKISQMKKLKYDIEVDIEDMKKELNPEIFPDLEQRVIEYKEIDTANRLFFSALFSDVLELMDEVNNKISKIPKKFSKEIKELQFDLSYQYILYFNLLDDYEEKNIELTFCEERLININAEAVKIKRKVEEVTNESK